jgi:ABC-2 type transport system permease protein/fluoroquinolone transport system permease protein
MIRKLASQFIQDLILTFRSGHIYVMLLLATLLLVLVFTLPDDLDLAPPELFYDASESQVFSSFLKTSGLAPEAVFTDETAFNAALADEQRAIGIVFQGSPNAPAFEIITQGKIAPENIQLMQATLNAVMRILRGESLEDPAELTLLMPASDPIPLNKNMIPIFMTFEVILLGFLIGAVLIFQSKQEGTLLAYRVSPGGTLLFILSKALLYAMLSLIYGLVVAAVAFGPDVNYLSLSALIFLSSAFMTFLGLGIAVFFNNISEWFFAGMLLLVSSMLPTISYAVPVFSPRLITLIPTYQIIFGFRNILFNMGSPDSMLRIFLTAGIGTLAAFIFCYRVVDTRLMRDGV